MIVSELINNLIEPLLNPDGMSNLINLMRQKFGQEAYSPKENQHNFNQLQSGSEA